MNRLTAYASRLRKERPKAWMDRHARVRARIWSALWNHAPAEARLAQAERRMRRLCALKPPWTRMDHLVLAALLAPVSLFPARLER